MLPAVSEHRRIARAAALGALLSGAPSTVWALARTRSARGAWHAGVQATRAIGTVAPPGRPGAVRGAAVHGAISVVVAETLAAMLPQRRAVAFGALAGLSIGVLNVVVVAPRRYPAIAALPVGPQLADNAAFGAIVAWSLRRPAGDRPASRRDSRLDVVESQGYSFRHGKRRGTNNA